MNQNGMRFYVLSINYINDAVYQITDTDALKAALGVDQIDAANISSIMADEDAQEIGTEYSDEGRSPHVTSLEGIRLITCDAGEDHWIEAANGWGEECQVLGEYAEEDVRFTPSFYEPLDEGLTIAGTMPECQHNYALCLPEDEAFDPHLLAVGQMIDGDEGEMHVTYNGQELKFLGMGRGDEDRDYFEFTTIYLNGDVILQS